MSLIIPGVLFASILSTVCLVSAAPTTCNTTSTTSSPSTTSTTTYPSTAPSCAPAVPIGQYSGPFARVDGSVFKIDGRAEYFAGTNTWWLGYLMQDADVDLALSQIAASKLKVTRIWGFGNVNNPVDHDWGVYFQVLNLSLSETGQYINFNPANGIPRLDYVISAAERYGVKLVLPLLNNWDALGGINSYTTAFGGNSTSFYTDQKSQAAYKNYIKFIVERYKESSAIFAWELCNEPRCRGCPPSTIYNWASDISAYIKSLDRRHMVTLGDEGWFYAPEGDGSYAYSGYEGVDFVGNLGIETLDYSTFHLYPDQWGYNYSWGSEWILQHDAACQAAGKVCVLEEYGASSDMVANMQPWQETVLCNTTNIGYDSFWQFGTSGVGATDEYSVFYNTSEYQVLATQHAEAMLKKVPVANVLNGVIT